MADKVKHILTKPIQLADNVSKAADEASSFKQECAELKSRTEKLAELLRQAARTSSDLYERADARRIIDDTGPGSGKGFKPCPQVSRPWPHQARLHHHPRRLLPQDAIPTR
ncbi:unnamed protein product [Cuscuta epithymum]|uniref:DUF7792 domain-containing protein n=1 Tax=Cuscuta epithymum TaxID=186058 RepID=A0AAV0EBE7_9ASTE|nr:unnamed protein product [Cuscuta epithymum]